MTRWQPIAYGLLAGVAFAVTILLLVVALRPEPAADTDEAVPAHMREDTVPEATPEVKTLTVMIYQRALTPEVILTPVPAKIYWLPAPAARARQIVRFVLEGIPSARGVVKPSRAALVCREVFVDPRGTAWVDLEPAGVAKIEGSDEEQSVVAAVARSLVEGIDEVHRVGLLVGGEPRRTLAGHVDLSRTYSGREWPSTRDRAARSAQP